MNRDEAELFAREWIASWNRADLDSILAHYSEDVVFTSPYASAILGRPLVVGKEALRTYWAEGLRRATICHQFREALFDDRRPSLAIIYMANINGTKKEACEVMRFDVSGKVRASEAYYGAPGSLP